MNECVKLQHFSHLQKRKKMITAVVNKDNHIAVTSVSSFLIIAEIVHKNGKLFAVLPSI